MPKLNRDSGSVMDVQELADHLKAKRVVKLLNDALVLKPRGIASREVKPDLDAFAEMGHRVAEHVERKILGADLLNHIGVDPGANGGLVSIQYSLTGQLILNAVPMPKTERDIWEWFRFLPTENTFAVIEKVSTSPQMGVVSAGTFMGGYYGLRMALTAANIPFEVIPPREWQTALSIPSRKKHREGKKVVYDESTLQWKDRLRAKAQQLFPSLPLWNEPKSKGRQLAVADALLIAEFCRRKRMGLL